MMKKEFSPQKLVILAQKTLNPKKLSLTAQSGGVASALLTKKGNTYVGVCLDVSCSIGFCAEHTAIGAMITAGESEIDTIVAVAWDGTIYPPCGRCRELIHQVNYNNLKTKVILKDKIVSLEYLLPEVWTNSIPKAEIKKNKK